ncbi:MAG TPA: Uma2 family endonuclease [Armatimonadetes bacterium]|nr:Uma2 family endonuclease [Armatimonadota bacterium]
MAKVAEVVPEEPQRMRMTWEEFRALPEGPPFYEFEDGEVIPVTRPHGRHQQVLKRLLGVLDRHIVRHRLGEVWPEIDVEVGPGKVYSPDLVFLRREHLSRYSEEEGEIHGPPDLVVEILLPTTRRRDRIRKYQVYGEAGVEWYWLVDPDDLSLEEYQLTPQGYVGRGRVEAGEVFRPGLFPGLEINLQTLLAGRLEEAEGKGGTGGG